MNRIFGIMLAATFFIHININALPAVNDSATVTSGSTGTTFYNLETGEKTVASNLDWHLALSLRPADFPNNTLQSTTIRINEAFGAQAYIVPGFTADSFSVSLDTANISSWQQVHDSDTSLDEGAFNHGYNIGAFNYGWGVYAGPPTHNVNATKEFVVQLPNHGFQKLWITLTYDSAWDIRAANLDNSNLRTIHVSKQEYAGKNFVYLNLVTDNVFDKEPLSSDWDLQFLEYAATDVTQGATSPAVGVWLNKGRIAAKRAGVNVNDNDYSALTFSSSMNTIGWNWKYPANNLSLGSGKNDYPFDDYYSVYDSLSYFVKTLSGDVYKIVFTAYEGSSTGKIKFTKEKLTATGINEIADENSFSIYPNPANSILNVVSNSPSAEIKIFDLNGKIIAETKIASQSFQLNTSNLANGVYVIAIASNDNISLKKFVVAR